MGVELFEVKSRTPKNETTEKMWKLSNGFKMSQKAVDMLGISSGENRLVFGITDNGNPAVKCTSDKEYHCRIGVSNNIISHNGIISKLTTFGEEFTISTSPDSEGFYEMTPLTNTVKSTEIQSEINNTEVESENDLTEDLTESTGIDYSVEHPVTSEETEW